MGPHAEKVQQLAANATVSGSIVRIYAPVALTVDDYTFGKFVEGGDNIDYQTSSTSIAVPAGSYLEGPFTQLHTSAHVSVVYYNGALTVS
tara:strand:+ start:176 stop:445 length:270 start_codon:yes stop_codon:yes gene_type:complete